MLSTSNKGLSVTWLNLSVLAEQKKQSIFTPATISHKEIIHNVDGVVKPGTLVAILGASGSGKTTLMSALANRVPGNLHVSGSIKIGGKLLEGQGDFMRYVSSFVYQEDLFIPTLTVFEHLNFTAKLKLDKTLTEKVRKHIIYDVLTELGLLDIADRRIGNSQLGNEKVNLSGGERKRLSIATELLTDPSLLFCDEPTTGLDSYTALNVIRNLKRLVNHTQKTIICSIHQPNDAIFGLFHQIILMSNGKIAFSGNSDEALEFFKSQGYNYLEGQNPAEYLVKSLANVAVADELFSSFKTTEYYQKMITYTQEENKNDPQLDPVSFHYVKFNEPAWVSKLRHLTHRNFLDILRNRPVTMIGIIRQTSTATLFGLCLRGSITPTQTGLQAFQGIVFLMFSQNLLPQIFSGMCAVPEQMPLFIREHANRTNTPLLFYTSRILSLLPRYLVESMLFTAIIYSLAGLSPNITKWLLTYLIITLIYNISNTFGTFTLFAFGHWDIAYTCNLPIGEMLQMSAGLFVKISTIPMYMRWVSYISWLRYATEALYIIHFQDVDYIECSRNLETPCLRNGSEVLASLDFDANNLQFNVAIMFLIYFWINFMTYLGLLYRIRSRTISSFV